MGDDDKAVGRIEGALAAIQADVSDIKAGKMALCQLHTQRLDSIDAKLETLAEPTEASLGPLKLKGFTGRDVGRIVAIVLLAYVALRLAGVPMPTVQTVQGVASAAEVRP